MGILRVINGYIVILLISSFTHTSMAEPRTTIAAKVCNSTIAYSGKILAANFVPAMYNLSNLINLSGFGTTKVGQDPIALYGLAQCYKDLSSIDCRLCFSELRSLLPTCYPRTGGRIFLDGCFGRFENFSFYDQGLDSVEIRNCSSSRNNSQPDKFRASLAKVIENLKLRALKNNGFAVGSDYASNFSVHALAQCWESLDNRACYSCLQAAGSSIMSCSPFVEGRVLNAGCYMRYSTMVFWNSNPDAGNSSVKSKSLWIILGSVLCGCLILTGLALWKVKGSLATSRKKSLKDSYAIDLPDSISHSKLLIKYKELKRATNNFDLSNKLGQGSYGTVYKGILHDGREVAVKQLFLNTRQWVDQFFNEVNLVNQVRHKNLVKLLACSVDGPESLLVYDYYFNRSLDYFIFDKRLAKLLDWQKRFDIIQGVAEGLSYLHEESDIRIVHRDIKASNILLDDNFKPKITDFGIARSFGEDQTHVTTGIAGTLGYMAPEYVVHGHLTEKADVYSFGVLILEIVTGLRCNNGIGAKTGNNFLAMIWSHYKAKTIRRIIDKSFFEDKVEDAIVHVVHIGLLCIQATPSYRPTMAKVVELLRSNGDHRDVILTEPPFLDVLTTDLMEEGEGSDLLHLATAPSFSESSGSLVYGR